MLNIQSWTELCCFVTACELRGCVSCWIPHSEKCCCCLTAASICMHLVWQKVLTTCNIFVLIMSVKPRPRFISLLAWSFTIRVWLLSSRALPVRLQPWDQHSKVKWTLLARYFEDKSSDFCLFGVFLSGCILSDLRLSLKAHTVSDKHQSKRRSERARDRETDCQTCSSSLGTA